MKTDWHNQDEVKDLVLLRQKHGQQWGEIKNYLKRKYGSNHTANACSSKFYRMKEAGGLLDLAWELVAPEEPSYNELVEAWNEWLGRTVREIQTPTTGDDGRRRGGIISDTHAPFEARDVVAAFVANGPYDLAIHGGDLLDWYAVSGFVKHKHVDPRLEVQHGTWVLEKLAGCATQVELVSDNHSRRLLKALTKANLPTELMELLQWFMPELDLFKLMAKGLPNVRIADPVEVVEGVHFFGQYGDLVVGHADSSSKLKLRAAENLDYWLGEWKESLGLKPWRLVAQAHTHQLGLAYGAGGHKAYMEIGSCCSLEAMSYALRGKLGYRPPVPAFTVFEQIRDEQYGWRTDFNSIRQVLCR